MDNNYIVQISIVAVIILVAIVWVTIRVVKRATGNQSGCDCCELSKGCGKRQLVDGGKIKRSELSGEKCPLNDKETSDNASIHPNSSPSSGHPDGRHDEPAARN